MFEPADLIFIGGQNFSDKVSRAVSGSRWDHTGLVINPQEILLLDGGLVRFAALDDYILDQSKDVEIWNPMGLPTEERLAIIVEAEKLLGQPLGLGQQLAKGIRCLFNRTLPVFYKRHWTPTGIPLKGYRISSVFQFRGIDPKEMDIEEFYQAVVNSGRFQLIYSKTSISVAVPVFA